MDRGDLTLTFDEFFAALDGGTANLELTHGLRQMVHALRERATEAGRAKGEIAITITFAAADNGRVEIAATSKLKFPGPRKAEETRWLGEGGALLASDPRQAALPLKVAVPGPTPLRNPKDRD